jgi:peptidyl-prolyl cis-trans isomerase D
MLVWVRNLMESWVARGFFALLVAVFVFWGVSNVFTMTGGDTSVARVGGKPVDISLVQAAYQNALNQMSESGQGQPDQGQRQQIASQALVNVLRQQVLRQEEQSLGLAVPDAALRKEINDIPAFQTNGVFDKAKFAQVLQQNNSSPSQFISELQDDIAARQLLQPLFAGVTPPEELLNRLFAMVAEQRFAETVSIPVAAQAVPAVPADPVLQRYWRNDPAKFTTPEYRSIKIVILSPALLALHEQVAQADVDAAYARAVASAASVPERSVQVLSVDSLAASSRLEVAWKQGASWNKMQDMAKRFGATSIFLDKAQQAQIPAPDLADAIFAAQPGEIVGPVAGSMGMYVFKVTAVSQSGPDEVALKAQIMQQLQLQKAQVEVAQDVNAVQDALAGQTPLDQLPGNLGLAALQGTLDANGNKPDGGEAPIPGGDDLKAAIAKAAFAAHLGDPAQLINGPGGSYFALTVDKIMPPALAPFDQVRGAVLTAWRNDEMTREAELKAAALMQAVNNGQDFAKAAAAAGGSVITMPAITRSAPPGDADGQMIAVLFSLKPGQGTMLQTSTGFTVAKLTKIVQPVPSQTSAAYVQLKQAMTKSLQDDIGGSFLAGLQVRDKVSVNQKLLTQIYQ